MSAVSNGDGDASGSRTARKRSSRIVSRISRHINGSAVGVSSGYHDASAVITITDGVLNFCIIGVNRDASLLRAGVNIEAVSAIVVAVLRHNDEVVDPLIS